MALVRKDTPGSAPGYTWVGAGEVIEVHDELAHQLFAIPGFTEVPPETALTETAPPTPQATTAAVSVERQRKVTRRGE